jgi:CRP-like cAMP-binding protein
MDHVQNLELIKKLRDIQLFQWLDDDELRAIVQAPENGVEEHAPKQLIIREAEIGNCMYVILDGSVDVTLRGEFGGREVAVATLYPGDFFGEQALLPGGTGRRNASVRAVVQTRLFRIDKKYVLLSIKRDPAMEDKTRTITMVELPEDKEIKELLTTMRLFRSLNQDEVKTFRTWTEVMTVGPGEFIIKEQQPGEHLYVVVDGTVEVFTMDQEGRVIVLAEHKRGNYFGEQALMPDSDGKRSAFVRSNQKCRLLKVPKKYFRLLLNRDSQLAEALRAIGKVQRQQIDKITKS